jgi:uncharacterized membrane protein
VCSNRRRRTASLEGRDVKRIYRPTSLTLVGLATIIAAIAGTTGYIIGRAPALPAVLPVHFDHQGFADRFVRASYPIALVPVWIQLTLSTAFGAIAAVLLYRTHTRRTTVEDKVTRQERERMLMAAEAISLLAAIWVAFQGLLAVRLIMMWQAMCCGLGEIYYQVLIVCIVLSVVVGIRAAVYLQYPKPVIRETDAAHWKFRGIYFNPGDPAVFVPLRTGLGWTINFGRPQAILFVGVLLCVGILAPLIIMRVLLGE